MNHTDIYLYKIDANLEQDSLYTQSFIYDSLCADTIVSGNIDLTDCQLQVGFGDIPIQGEYFARLNVIHINAFPNPAQDEIRFAYTNTDHYENIKLRCYNSIGKKVQQEHILCGQQGSKLNLSNWNSGIYIAVVTSNERIVGKVKFVVRGE